MLTSRFLFDLQQVDRKLASSSEITSELSEVEFCSHKYHPGNVNVFIRSLGSQLSFDEDDDEQSQEAR